MGPLVDLIEDSFPAIVSSILFVESPEFGLLIRFRESPPLFQLHSPGSTASGKFSVYSGVKEKLMGLDRARTFPGFQRPYSFFPFRLHSQVPAPPPFGLRAPVPNSLRTPLSLILLVFLFC